jgi:hypothetical protein
MCKYIQGGGWVKDRMSDKTITASKTRDEEGRREMSKLSEKGRRG